VWGVVWGVVSELLSRTCCGGVRLGLLIAIPLFTNSLSLSFSLSLSLTHTHTHNTHNTHTHTHTHTDLRVPSHLFTAYGHSYDTDTSTIKITITIYLLYQGIHIRKKNALLVSSRTLRRSSCVVMIHVSYTP
jgi:hypothetical protein